MVRLVEPVLFRKFRHTKKFFIINLLINETLKWLSSLPNLMQESFRWWQCSVSYSLPRRKPLGISVLLLSRDDPALT